MREIRCVHRFKGFRDCEFVRYFLNNVSILGFCDFVIFHYYRNILILQSCSLCFQE